MRCAPNFFFFPRRADPELWPQEILKSFMSQDSSSGLERLVMFLKGHNIKMKTQILELLAALCVSRPSALSARAVD